MIITPSGQRFPTVTADGIYGFFGDYRFLSNFHPLETPIQYRDHTFWTSEAAYMSAKTDDESLIQQLSELGPLDGNKAKKLGRRAKLREGWDQVKAEVMYDVTYQKYKLDVDLRERLLATGELYLEETNNWGDTYWGVCNGIGYNMLGRIIMLVRGCWHH